MGKCHNFLYFPAHPFDQGWKSRGGRGGPDPHGPMELKKLWGPWGSNIKNININISTHVPIRT